MLPAGETKGQEEFKSYNSNKKDPESFRSSEQWQNVSEKKYGVR